AAARRRRAALRSRSTPRLDAVVSLLRGRSVAARWAHDAHLGQQRVGNTDPRTRGPLDQLGCSRAGLRPLPGPEGRPDDQPARRIFWPTSLDLRGGALSVRILPHKSAELCPDPYPSLRPGQRVFERARLGLRFWLSDLDAERPTCARLHHRRYGWSLHR